MDGKQTSGKKIATIIIGSIMVASLFAVLVIQLFYKTYDPSKYGRKNGGIDKSEESAPLTNELYEDIIISNSR